MTDVQIECSCGRVVCVRVAHPVKMESPQEHPATVPQEATWLRDLEDYTQDHRRANRHSERYSEQVRRLARDMMAALNLPHFGDVTEEHCRWWMGQLAEGRRSRSHQHKRPSTKTLRNSQVSLTKLWRWLKATERVTSNPWLRLATPTKRDHEDRRAATLDEMRRLIEVAASDELSDNPRCRNRAGQPIQRSTLYMLMAATGLRYGACERLRWRHMRLAGDHPTIEIPEDLTRKATPGSLAIPEPLRSLLEAQRLETGGEPDSWVWGPVHRDVLRSDVRAAEIDREDSRGRQFGWHSFRRGVITYMSASGTPIKTIQRITGHRTTAIVLDHYAKAENHPTTQTIAGNADAVAGRQPAQKNLPLTIAGGADCRYIRSSEPGSSHESSSPRPSSGSHSSGVQGDASGGEPPATDSPASRADGSEPATGPPGNRFESCCAHLPDRALAAELLRTANRLADLAGQLIAGGSPPERG